MSEHDDVHLVLGSHVIGALDAASRADVEHHLRTCDDCRAEVAELAVLPGLLARLTPEQFAVGHQRTPQDLLPALLTRAHASARSSRRRLVYWRGAATLALAAAVALGVVAWPRTPARATPQYQLRATAPGASGTVALAAKAWGTAITLSLRGLPSTVDCVAYVIDASGRVQPVGTWGPTPNHDAVVDLATSLPTRSLSRITVATASGRTLLAARLVAS